MVARVIRSASMSRGTSRCSLGTVVKYAVKSLSVKAFNRPPTRTTAASISPLPYLGDPWKSMCSTQWEAPVTPGHSFFAPTRYQTQTLAVGLPGSGASSTFRPFGRENRSGRRNAELGGDMGAMGSHPPL
ncbi:MAG: hypothetical protein L3K08_04855 [Thermoplasmata archaeon]|nr:hypothetical protein [Thermoplasmata archaeon]